MYLSFSILFLACLSTKEECSRQQEDNKYYCTSAPCTRHSLLHNKHNKNQNIEIQENRFLRECLQIYLHHNI